MAQWATREVLGVKIETTYNDGTTVPTAAADAIMVEELNWAFADARLHERNPVKPTFGALGDLYAGALIEITGKVEIKGSGTAGTAPEVDPVLRACGLAAANVALTSDTYTPTSTGHESVTAYYWEDGLLYKVTGCRGAALKATAEIGKPGMFEFALKGHFAGPIDEVLPAPTFDAQAPVVAHGMAFVTDGFSPNISGFNADFGGSLIVPDDLTAADGFGEIHIGGPRRVVGGFDPLSTLVAEYDWVAKWKANNAASMTTGVIGATAGNRWQMTFPKTQYREIGRADNNGIRKRDIGFLAQETAGDDEFSLVFT